MKRALLLALFLMTSTARWAGAVEWLWSGSGFLINSRGDVVTNAHVVAEKGTLCPILSVETLGKASAAKVVAIDAGADLAVLRLVDPGQLIDASRAARPSAPPPLRTRSPAPEESPRESWVAFTGGAAAAPPAAQEPPAATPEPAQARSSRSFAHLSQSSPVRGQRAILVGFPLAGTLSSEHKVTDGLVASLRGPNDDPRRIQISVPANPGNSGGPVFSDTGSIIGVLVSGFDQHQGANFGVSLPTLKDFLRQNKVPFSEADGREKVATEDLMAEAVHYTVFIRCGQ